MKKTSPFLAGLAVCVGLLSACGSSKPSADTVASTVIDTTTADETTVAPADTTAAATGTNETTVASDAVAVPSTVAGQAAKSDDPVAAIAGLLGITDKKDLDCLQQNIGDVAAAPKTADPAGVDPNVLRALIKCQPPQIVDATKGQLGPLLPNAKPEQIDCVARAVLSTLAEGTIDISVLMGGSTAVPAELQDKLKENAKSCGISDADLAKLAKAAP